jgi:hypothetical protein
MTRRVAIMKKLNFEIGSKKESLLLGFILLFSFSGTPALSQDRVIAISKLGECDLTVEANDRWHTLRLRALHPKYKGCHIDEASVVQVLSAAFSRSGPPQPAGSYSSLSIGRLIDYPWLSQYLATTARRDPGWNPEKGKPLSMDINKYVSRLLFSKELTAQIETVIEKGGYRVVGVTVEKVLVGGFREVPLYQGKMHAGRVPYDAQVWFRLERVESAGPLEK